MTFLGMMSKLHTQLQHGQPCTAANKGLDSAAEVHTDRPLALTWFSATAASTLSCMALLTWATSACHTMPF